MNRRPSKNAERKREPDLGGLEFDIPDEVIQKDIKDYSYIIGKLKDC